MNTISDGNLEPFLQNQANGSNALGRNRKYWPGLTCERRRRPSPTPHTPHPRPYTLQPTPYALQGLLEIKNTHRP